VRRHTGLATAAPRCRDGNTPRTFQELNEHLQTRRCRQCPKFMVTLRKHFLGRIEPRTSRSQPAPTRRKRPESQRCSPRAARASANQPTAHRCVHPPRTAPSSAAPTQEQPHQAAGTRRHATHLSRATRTTRDLQRSARSVLYCTRFSATSPQEREHMQSSFQTGSRISSGFFKYHQSQTGSSRFFKYHKSQTSS